MREMPMKSELPEGARVETQIPGKVFFEAERGVPTTARTCTSTNVSKRGAEMKPFRSREERRPL
jgi:hypothetical protein